MKEKMKRLIPLLTVSLLTAIFAISFIFVSPADAGILPDERILIAGVRIYDLKRPVEGETVDVDAYSREKGAFIDSITWYEYDPSNESDMREMSSNETFKRGKGYEVEIVLSLGYDYVFTNEYARIYLNDVAVNSVKIDGDLQSAVINYDYGELYKYIGCVNIYGFDMPVAGGSVDSEGTVDGEGFDVVSMGWYDLDGDKYDHGERIYIDDYYEFRATLKAQNGYKFNSRDALTVFFNDRTARKVTVSRNGKTVDIVVRCGNPEYAEIEAVNPEIATPLAGAQPSYTVEDTSGAIVDADYNAGDYRYGVAWYDASTGRLLSPNETFKAGEKYRVSIVLSSWRGYTFIKGTSNVNYTVNGQKATYFCSDEDPVEHIIIETVFEVDDPITSVKLEGIETPVAGEKPNFNITTNTVGVTVDSVRWIRLHDDEGYEELTANSTFVMGENYRVFVYLKTTGDKAFAYNASTEIAGYSVVFDGNYFVVNEEAVGANDDFHEGVAYTTYACDTEVIHYVGISRVDPPIPGEHPDFVVETDSNSFYAEDGVYDGTVNGVMWIDYSDGGRVLTKDDVFLPGHRYRLIVYLRAQGDCTFAFDPNTGITVKGEIECVPAEIAMVTSAHNTMCIFRDYQCPKEVLDRVDITVTVPTVGIAPDFTEIRTDKVYSNGDAASNPEGVVNGILWYDAGTDGVYAEGEAIRPNNLITFCVVLTPTESYTFGETLDVYINGEKPHSYFKIGDALTVAIDFAPNTCEECRLELLRGTAATCTETGTEHSYRCTKCGQIYKDVDATEPVYATDGWGIIPVKPHDYRNATQYLGFEDSHLAYCKDCGEECRIECNIVDREVYGPSEYSRYDAIVSSCTECRRVYSVYVEEWMCDHVMDGWKSIVMGGEHTGVHYNSCPCGLNYVEEECSNSIKFVKGPYNGIERDVVLYVCEHCGGEMMAPVEMGPDVEYVENYKDPDTDIILDFSNGNVIIHPYATITVSLVPEESVPEDLQSDIEVKFGEYTDFYVWYNVSINYGNESQVYCVAPTGEYKVSIPAPPTIDDNKTTRVCIVSPNYDFVKTVETEEADGRLYFTTDTFGNFIVVGDEDPMYIVGYQPKNGGSGSHPADMVEPGESYTLDDCSYLIPPEGFRFKCWEIDGVEYQPGDTITINKDTYVYAIWELIPVEDDEPDEPNEPVEPVYPDDPTGGEGNDQPEEKDHSKCQANGWKRFWNAIGNFFRMIFGLPKKCVCGDKIYE